MKILVCGGGASGTFAAIAAARKGVDVTLIEQGGALGGMLTSGLLGYVLDEKNKSGLIREFLDRVEEERNLSGAAIYEVQKYVLEQLCLQAGVHLLLHTTFCGVETEGRKITGVTVTSKSGMQTLHPALVIDATGDGDVAAAAGCKFTVGNATGQTQPMSMIAVISGLNKDEVEPYLASPEKDFWEPRKKFAALLESLGVKASMGCPNICQINDSLFYLSVNHEYGKRFDSAEDLTAATMEARKEIYEIAKALHASGGAFRNLSLAATPETIGVREGRRIQCLYTVTVQDLLEGKKQEDDVCTATYWVDIHALSKDNGGSFTGQEISVKPYDIPFRALLPEDCDNLILAGRSIGGDFYAHASYRVIGNMACVGEAAGRMAAESLEKETDIKQTKYVK